MALFLQWKTFAAISVFLLLQIIAFGSQFPEVEWSKTFGGPFFNVLNSVEQTSDGGYILAGTTKSQLSERTQGWLIKTGSKGVMEWEKNIFDINGDVQIRSVRETTDGGYVLAGWLQTKNNRSGKLIKTDSKGVIEWERTYPNYNNTETELDSVQQTSDEGYIAAGVTGGYAWLIKTDSKGITEWERIFGCQDCWPGFALSEIQQTSDGGYIGVGLGTSKEKQPNGDGWLIKTDPKGVREWEKSFGGSDWYSLTSVQETADCGYIASGKAQNSKEQSGWLIKTDSKGIEEWEKTFENGYDLRSVKQAADTGYIIAGTFAKTIPNGSSVDFVFEGWLIKTDSKGAVEWEKTFDGPDFCELNSIQETTDGGYIMAGETKFDEIKSMDGLLIKLKGKSAEKAG